MTISEPCLRAWQIDTRPEPSICTALIWLAFAVFLSMAVLLSGISGYEKFLLNMAVAAGLVFHWRRRPQVIRLRATPAQMRLSLLDGKQHLLLPPWKAKVLPAMVVLDLPGYRCCRHQVVFFRHQFDSDDWRVLCTLLRHV